MRWEGGKLPTFAVVTGALLSAACHWQAGVGSLALRLTVGHRVQYSRKFQFYRQPPNISPTWPTLVIQAPPSCATCGVFYCQCDTSFGFPACAHIVSL